MVAEKMMAVLEGIVVGFYKWAVIGLVKIGSSGL